MSVSMGSMAAKVRASRPVRNLKGELIELTNQHRSLVNYICRHGYSYKEIARDIGESLDFVKHRMAQVIKLSGCRNQGQLGVWAAKQGLV